MERNVKEYLDLLQVEENAHSFQIKKAYQRELKQVRKSDVVDKESVELELQEACMYLLELRKQNKAQIRVTKDHDLRVEIRRRITAKKFFAPKAWFAAAFSIIVWAILQEIIMASTDIVDNVFVNWMKTDQIKGLDTLQNYISDHWTGVSTSLVEHIGLPAEYVDLQYDAGQIAVNGVTASNQLYTIMFCVVSGSCYGIGVFSAQYFGAGNNERLRKITALKFYFTGTVTVLFTMCMIPGITEPLIKFTTNPVAVADPFANSSAPELVNEGNIKATYEFIQYRAATLATQEGVLYFRTIAVSYILLAFNESIITSLRETRRPIYSFIMAVIALITNCILNVFLTAPTFLGSFEGLGVQGCAIATATARLFQTIVITIVILINRFEFFPIWSSFVMKWKFASRVLLKAAPIIFNELLYAFGQVLIVKLKGMYSVEVLTANAMYTTIIMALFSPLYHGMNAGISVYVGNELGAERYDVAQYNAKHLIRLSICIGTIFGLLLTGICWVIPDALFSNANHAAKHYASWMMLIYGLVYPFYIIGNGCYSILRTGGSMWGAFIMDSGFVWAIQIPVLAILIILNKNKTIHIDYILIHLITVLTYIIQCAIALFIYSKKRWVRSLTSDDTPVSNEGEVTILDSNIVSNEGLVSNIRETAKVEK